MNFFEGIKLGFLQGATEFLPVSSSGHLALLSSNSIDLFTEVLLHAATLLSILAVLYKEFSEVFFAPFRAKSLYKTHGKNFLFKDNNCKLLLFIIAASIPAGIAGLLIEKHMEHILTNKLLIAAALTATGLVLLGTRFFPRKEKAQEKELKLKSSLLIGVAQAFAIIPGLSRSGLTISTALYQGINREKAGIFSFLLSIPVIAGATLMQLMKLSANTTIQFVPVFHITGFITAFLSGYIALRLLIKLVKMGKFYYFAWYCFTAAAITFILQAVR